MATITDILNLIKSLPPDEQIQLRATLLDDLPKVSKMEQIISESRFSGGLVCPLCGCIGHVSRNGHRKDGKQRYLCNDCGKSFISNTRSITSGTRKDINTWAVYMKCMANGMSVRKTADECNIHKNTAFTWRHKILDALQNVAASTKLDGIVEADETFFAISYKGNHKKSFFKMPRNPHKRGSSVHTRGLSQEQVCVPCAIDREGRSLSKIATCGRIRTRDLHHVYDGRITPDATLCTDKMNSYIRFANSNQLKLVQLKTGNAKKGIYNIQHINAYHSKLKKFIYSFSGVSTKYLNNYLLWNSWLNAKGGTLHEKTDSLLKTALPAITAGSCRGLSSRPAIPLPSQ